MERCGAIIQVAGVGSRSEAEMLISCGITHIGLPLGPGVREQDMETDEAASMVAALRLRARFVLITYLTEPDDVAQWCRRIGVHGVQLHGEPTPAQAARLRERMPELFIIKSLVVGAGDVLAEASAFAPHVDAFLTDTFDPSTGARGATGMTHDWEVSRAVVLGVDRPVILAGGLDETNVAEAIRATGAAGVDAHTGLEAPDGSKDETKVRLFAERARAVLS